MGERDERDERNEAVDAKLQEAQRLETVGRLAGGVAHDFNNILQAILMHLGFALDQLPPVHPAREDLDEVRANAQRATRLVEQLLAFSRRQLLQLELVDVDELLLGMSRMVRRVCGEHITVEFDLQLQQSLIKADRGQLEQVVYNLCINARDAMPTGGDLRISTGMAEVGPELARMHPWVDEGTMACLTVEDNGLGMDADVVERLFEPFFTTKGPEHGTGLGLSTAHGIIKQHGGLIQVTSRPGQGSVFRVYLPLTEGVQLSWDESSEYSLRMAAGERILLAEDDDSIRNAVVRGLTREGYEVLAAPDGDRAVELFHSDPDGIDLAVLDVVMPLRGGVEAYEEMSRERPDLPVLFSTGYGADASPLAALQGLDVELLQKPYDIPTLVMRIRDILDRLEAG